MTPQDPYRTPESLASTAPVSSKEPFVSYIVMWLFWPLFLFTIPVLALFAYRPNPEFPAWGPLNSTWIIALTIVAGPPLLIRFLCLPRFKNAILNVLLYLIGLFFIFNIFSVGFFAIRGGQNYYFLIASLLWLSYCPYLIQWSRKKRLIKSLN